MLHTGLHNDYHRPSDDADKINVEGTRQVAALMFNLVVELAVRRPGRFSPSSRQESHATQIASERGLAQLPGRLGISWDEKQAADRKIVIDSVSPLGRRSSGRASWRPRDAVRWPRSP